MWRGTPYFKEFFLWFKGLHGLPAMKHLTANVRVVCYFKMRKEG